MARYLLGFVEQLTHPLGADADDHLDELAGRGAEEGHIGLAGGRPGQQRLAGAGLAFEQNPARRAGSHLPVLVGALEEVDDLVHLLFDLVDAGNIGEVDSHRRLLDGLHLALHTEAAEATARLRDLAEGPDRHTDQQAPQHQRGDQIRDCAALLDHRCRAHDRPVGLQIGQQIVLRKRRALSGELGVIALFGAVVTVVRQLRLVGQFALDGIALGVDLLDVSGLDLRDELGVGDRRWRVAGVLPGQQTPQSEQRYPGYHPELPQPRFLRLLLAVLPLGLLRQAFGAPRAR